MCKSICNRNPVLRIIYQHLPQQINCFCLLPFKNLVEFTLLFRLINKCLFVFLVFNGGNQVLIWVSNKICYHLQLFFFGTSWHQCFSQNKFSKDTANSPYVNSRSIFLVLKHNLWGPVPSGHNVVSHSGFVRRDLFDVCSRQPEVTNLQVAV